MKSALVVMKRINAAIKKAEMHSGCHNRLGLVVTLCLQQVILVLLMLQVLVGVTLQDPNRQLQTLATTHTVK